MYSTSSINKILFITLSNIGDCILSLPALDALKANSPAAKITVMSGPRPKEIFENNPRIGRLIIYEKSCGLKENIRLFRKLKAEKFEMVLDLRNSLFGAFLPVKLKSPPFLFIPKNIKHMKDRHLYKAQNAKRKAQNEIVLNAGKNSLYISPEDEKYIERILKENNITDADKIIVISPGARSQIKRWAQDKFSALISSLVEEFGVKIILTGDKDDLSACKYIAGRSGYPVVNLCAKTNIAQLACLLKRGALLITNDSAVLHLASYLNVPIVALFGPTNEEKYGPWSRDWAVVKKDIFCRPCEKAQCRFGTLDCLRLINVPDVMREIRNILNLRPMTYDLRPHTFKRILIVRTDRIGDVLLSTPVIKALRDSFPHSYIAMLVSPYAKDIVEGNPYLDEVIIYDKDGKHKSWQRSVKFALNLKKKKFDLGLILHPTNRVHLVTFFAGIPRRVGYDQKLGFLLTDRLKHTKQFGEKHELEYNLDLVRYLGIEPQEKGLFMPLRPESERYIEDLFQETGIEKSDKLLAIHPGASCPSKIWPSERFAQAADKLSEKYGFKVLLVAGPKDLALAENVIKKMQHAAVNLAGKTSVTQLASLLKRCRLFVSNDSGPVHIASAVGVPVISIFGRAQKGLSPQRWGPVGAKGRVLHKAVGCIECLAHNCVKEFACLKAITVGDCLKAAEELLNA